MYTFNKMLFVGKSMVVQEPSTLSNTITKKFDNLRQKLCNFILYAIAHNSI